MAVSPSAAPRHITSAAPFVPRAVIKVSGFDREIPVGEPVVEIRRRIDEAGPDGFVLLSRDGHPETYWRARTITFLRPEAGLHADGPAV